MALLPLPRHQSPRALLALALAPLPRHQCHRHKPHLSSTTSSRNGSIPLMRHSRHNSTSADTLSACQPSEFSLRDPNGKNLIIPLSCNVSLALMALPSSYNDIYLIQKDYEVIGFGKLGASCQLLLITDLHSHSH